MLELKNLHLAFGGDSLFEGIDAFVGERERIGLIGANGAGKSTLFKVITGDLSMDQGQVDWQSGKEYGILRQELDFPEEMPLMEYIKTAQADINNIDDKLLAIEKELENTPNEQPEKQMELAQQLYHWQEKKRLFGASKLEAQAEKIIEGLGYKTSEYQKPLSAFSGGWKMRAELGRLLLMQPDVLLLDEPTNHLDIYSIIWLEKWLTTYEGSVIFISHDIQFLQNVSARIWQLEHRKLVDYSGTYNRYLIHREETDEKKMSAFINQEKKLKVMQRNVDRFRAKASKAKMAQSLQKMIDKEEKIEIDNPDLRAMNIRWPEFHPGGRETVVMKNITHSYNKKDIVINDADLFVERNEKIGFVGKNGTGKSTMAKIMVGVLKQTSGETTVGYKVDPYYFDQYASDKLNLNLSILETVETSGSGLTTGEMRSLLGSFMFSGEDVHKKIKILSGGEKNRVALALMILSKSNFLILDEPTNHLDMKTRAVLREALLDYPGTLVVVSHDRTFLTGLTNRTYFFDYGRVTNYLGDINYVLEKENAENMRTLEIDKLKDEKLKNATLEANDQAIAQSEKANTKSDNSPKIKKQKSKSSAPKKPISKEERTQEREMRKKLKSVENKIVRLEEKKSAIETEMTFPDFYEQDDSTTVIAEYDTLKKSLGELNDQWEVLAEQME